MKILGGKYKGRNFFMPKGLRCTQNLVRKAVFDILGQDMEGLKWLDLFSGSGAIGLEAISRGAQKVTFVEKDSKCFKVIETNVNLLELEPYENYEWPCEIIQADSFAAIKQFAAKGAKFDIIFMDPPYGQELAKKALKVLNAYDILHPNCRVIIQHDKRDILPKDLGRFLFVKQKKYGSTYLTILESHKK